MTKLIINSMDDLSGIDTVIEGSMEVLKDDGNAGSPMHDDWQCIWDMMHERVFTVFPCAIELEGVLSGEQIDMVRFMCEDGRQTFDGFSASVE